MLCSVKGSKTAKKGHQNRVENPKTFLRIGSYYKTTIDKLKIMNHLKLLTKYN